MVIGPSGSGKSVLLTSLLFNVYKGCFERVFVFSPSIEVDQTWQAVKEYQRNVMHVDDKKEKLYFVLSESPLRLVQIKGVYNEIIFIKLNEIISNIGRYIIKEISINELTKIK